MREPVPSKAEKSEIVGSPDALQLQAARLAAHVHIFPTDEPPLKRMDYFIHPDLRRHPDELYRARLLVGIIYAYAIILLLTTLYIVLVAPIPQTSVPISTLLLTLLLAIYAGNLFSLRRNGSYTVCSHITIGFSALSIAIGVAVSGGPLQSPAMPVNVVPIILAFVLLGKRAGLIWAQWVFLIHTLMAIAGKWFIEYPQMLDTRYMEIHHGVHWLVTYGAIIGLMIVFDAVNARLKHERDAERARYVYLAEHDTLTHLPNRARFNECLTQAIARADEQGCMAALFMFDLDGFKPVNDSLGHDAGDNVLQIVAARLISQLRARDTVARLGGDEFAVIVDDLPHLDTVNEVAQKILKIVAEPIAALPSHLNISASVGVAIYPLHTNEKSRLIKLADVAMYRAKRAKNHWCLFEPSLEDVD